MRLPVGILVGAIILIIDAISVIVTYRSAPMTTSDQNQNDRVTNKHTSATLSTGESVTNQEVSVDAQTGNILSIEPAEGSQQKTVPARAGTVFFVLTSLP